MNKLTQIKSKPKYPEKNLSVQIREPTNSTHIWRQVWESNAGHIGGKRVLSPLRHPCSHNDSNGDFKINDAVVKETSQNENIIG